MKPVIYVSTDLNKAYYDDSFLGKVKDRLRIRLKGESFIKELGLTVAHVKLPPNFNNKAYLINMEKTKKFMRRQNAQLAPKTARNLDFNILNEFQRQLFAYGVTNSIKLLLRISQKSIKNSCITVYDAADKQLYDIVCELAKECKYLILVSNDIKRISILSDYVLASYGISPIVTADYNYALSRADFIVSSKEIETIVPVWYINNLFIPNNTSTAINDISFAVPWKVNNLEFSCEVLGAILSQMQERDVSKALRYNGIYLDKVKFNENIIEI
ncbi:hypothetical protein HMPREF1982_02466 [Clostridiales bacterium oral taxon 876 str. F0540]|nr:hypothetical protein HMPREF1982_02466 [Clostridiales bacterium oral taxon 876 str. F0540]